jgi:hypothetical protein
MPTIHAHAKECLTSFFDLADISEIRADNLLEAITIGRTFRLLSVCNICPAIHVKVDLTI